MKEKVNKMFYKKIMLFVKGIMYNKKYVKMEKSTFYNLIYTLLYEWNDLDDNAKKMYLKGFQKILDNE